MYLNYISILFLRIVFQFNIHLHHYVVSWGLTNQIVMMMSIVFFNTFNIISDFVLLRDTNINSPDIKKVIVKIYQDCNKKKLDN